MKWRFHKLRTLQKLFRWDLRFLAQTGYLTWVFSHSSPLLDTFGSKLGSNVPCRIVIYGDMGGNQKSKMAAITV